MPSALVIFALAITAALIAAVPINPPVLKRARSVQERTIASFGRLMSPKEQSMVQPYFRWLVEQDRIADPALVKASDQIIINQCGFTFNQYRVITNLLPQIQASVACSLAGLVWAGVDTPADLLGVSSLLANCDGTLINIAYYRGVYPSDQPDVCAYVSNAGNADFINAANVCNTALAMVLCSGIPTSTIVSSTTTSFTLTSTSVSVITSTETDSDTSISLSTTSITFSRADTVTLTGTVFSPVIVTVVSTSTSVSTTISGTATITLTNSGVFTSVTTVPALRTITVTQTVLPTCPGIRLRTCQCKPGRDRFVLIDSPVPYYQAECSCDTLGLEFADVNDHNIWAAQEAISECSPRHRGSAWIASWVGINHDDCLVLHSDGHVAVPANCGQRLPVLCKARHRNWTSPNCDEEVQIKADIPNNAERSGDAEPMCRQPPSCSCDSSDPSKPCVCDSPDSGTPGDCSLSSFSSFDISSGCDSSDSSSCSSKPCNCDCKQWTELACSSMDSWLFTDSCQICCCDKWTLPSSDHLDHQMESDDQPGLLKRSVTKTNKDETKVQQDAQQVITATYCVQTDANFAVVSSLDTPANQAVACLAIGATLADLSEADLPDLYYLFGACPLLNGAYFKSWDDLGANPCGYVYFLSNIFGFARFIGHSSDCAVPRGAICRFNDTTTTTSFGPHTPRTTTTTTTTSSTILSTTTKSTTITSTSHTTSTIQTGFLIPEISTVITGTTTTMTLLTAPTSSTIRTTTITSTTLLVPSTLIAQTVTFTVSTVTSTSTSFTDTTMTTTSIHLLGR